jgi:diaminopimelate epimerase
MQFFKGHGLGNDYIAVDSAALAVPLTPPAIRLICDRHRGIGSDGILVRVPAVAADFGLRIYNPDGTEAEKSGNGLRIFAAYLLDQGAVHDGDRFTVETPGGKVTMQLMERTTEGVLQVEVEMGTATFRSSAVGLTGPDREVDNELLELEAGDRLTINTVSMGNPHCVVWSEDLDPDTLRRQGPQVSGHPWFERGTNVQFARVAGPAAMDAWIWERGAGETLASGSSACAVASVAVRRGMVSGRQVEVRMPGGNLHITVGEDWQIVMRGPVEGVLRAEGTPDFLRRLDALG